MPDAAFRILHDLKGELGIPLATPELEILLCLLPKKEAFRDEIAKYCSLSRSGFQLALDWLVAVQSVVVETSEDDHRRNVYRISESIRTSMLEGISRLGGRPTLQSVIEVKSVEHGLFTRVGHRAPSLKCEYEIALNLFHHSPQTSSELAASVSYSETTFRSALKRLREHDLVEVREAPDDKRQKHYSLKASAVASIERAHQRYLAWLRALEQND